jgi:hypothetical protein
MKADPVFKPKNEYVVLYSISMALFVLCIILAVLTDLRISGRVGTSIVRDIDYAVFSFDVLAFLGLALHRVRFHEANMDVRYGVIKIVIPYSEIVDLDVRMASIDPPSLKGISIGYARSNRRIRHRNLTLDVFDSGTLMHIHDELMRRNPELEIARQRTMDRIANQVQ